MTMHRLAEIQRCRAEMVARSVFQRAQLADACRVWQTPLLLADKAISAGRFVVAHPFVLAGLGVVVAVKHPRRTLIWLRRGWTTWLFLRRLGVVQKSG